MIYSKSSADWAAKYDLKRCFKSGFIFPLIPCVLFVYIMVANMNAAYFDNEIKYIYKVFGDEASHNYFMLQYAYAACGVLSALYSFSFLTSVKKSNVYLSIGISRKQLAKNRILSSLVYIASAAVIPMIAALVINKLNFMVTPDLIRACFYYALVYFVDMLLGFAIGSAFTVSVGNIIESAVYSGIACLTPTIVFYSVDAICVNMINGFASIGYADTGFTGFCTDLFAYLSKWNPMEFSVIEISYRLSSEKTLKTLDSSEYFVVIFWLVAAAAIMLSVPKLIEKRKAENAGMLGTNKIAVSFAGGVIAFAVFAMVSGTVDTNRFFCYALCSVLPALIYIVIIAVLFRNKTDILNHIKGAAITAAVSVLITVTCASGVFGVYTSVPKAEEVEYAAVAPSGYEHFINYTAWDRFLRNSTALYGPMTDSEDIESVISMHEKVADGLEKGDNTVCFVYKLKNGKVITRYYRNVSDEGAKESLKVVDTNWYENFAISALTNEDFDYDKELDKIPDSNPSRTKIEQAEIDLQCNILVIYNDYNLGEVDILNSTLSDSVRLNDVVSAEEVKEFREVFAAELTQLNYEEVFYPKEQALYHVLISYGEGAEYDGPVMQNIPVYPSMKNTVNFIREHDIKVEQATADDIVSVSIKSLEKALSESEFYGSDSLTFRLGRSFASSYMSKAFYDEYYSVDRYISDDELIFLNEEKITDAATIEKYFTAFRSSYAFVGDNGAFVQFVFKDGSDLYAYIPEKYL